MSQVGEDRNITVAKYKSIHVRYKDTIETVYYYSTQSVNKLVETAVGKLGAIVPTQDHQYYSIYAFNKQIRDRNIHYNGIPTEEIELVCDNFVCSPQCGVDIPLPFQRKPSPRNHSPLSPYHSQIYLPSSVMSADNPLSPPSSPLPPTSPIFHPETNYHNLINPVNNENGKEKEKLRNHQTVPTVIIIIKIISINHSLNHNIIN